SSAVVQNKFKVSFNKSYHHKAPKILLKWFVTTEKNRTEETSVCWILLLKIRNAGNNLSYKLLSRTRSFLREILAHDGIMWRLGILSGYGCLILLYVQAHLRLYCIIIADDAVAAIDNDDVGDGDGVCDLWCFSF
uniref:Uncharacterized protein n=1 Tax=Glossina palpalis gambiensis TaxID=67801 RepID=A0A1B0BQT2_9MUSC